VVIYPSINEGMSKLNQAVIEEVVRLRIENELLRESAGQNPVYAAWEMRMDPKCHTLLGRMHSNNNELKRFYPLLVHAVMAINIMD
jgi:regulator of replication initiation timing